MAAKLNRTCIIDGEKYSYCPHCSNDKDKPTWSTVFCSNNCHDIYYICTEYREGRLSVIDAKNKLLLCDLSKLNKMKDNTKGFIEEIMNYNEEKVAPIQKEEINTISTTALEDDISVDEINVQDEVQSKIETEVVETPAKIVKKTAAKKVVKKS